jgi:hypothetical protein
MPITINIIACLECSCHIWVPQLVYFDKIHDTRKQILNFRFFSNAQSDSFRGRVGSHMTKHFDFKAYLPPKFNNCEIPGKWNIN